MFNNMVTLLSKEKIWAGQKFGDPSVHWQIALLNLQEAIVSDWFLHWDPMGLESTGETTNENELWN